LISSRLDEKFKSVFRILIASLNQSVHWNENTSKLLCSTCVRQKQKISTSNPFNRIINISTSHWWNTEVLETYQFAGLAIKSTLDSHSNLLNINHLRDEIMTSKNLKQYGQIIWLSRSRIWRLMNCHHKIKQYNNNNCNS